MQLKVVSIKPQSPNVCRARFTMIVVIPIFKLQSYCDTSYSRGGVNQMWILKNSNDMLEYIYSRYLSSCNNINSCDFSTLFTAIPHFKLNDKSRQLVQLCFMKIKVIAKLPNSEQSYKGKVKTHNYINRQNQSTTGKL